MKRKRPDFVDYLMLLLVIAFVNFFIVRDFFDRQTIQKSDDYYYSYGRNYEVGNTSVEAFVKLQDLPAVAIQAKGRIDSTQNFLMAEKYRYHNTNSSKTNQPDDEYYRLTFYDLNAGDEDPIEINLFDYLPDYKKGTQFSHFDVSLYEKDQKAFIKVKCRAYGDGTLHDGGFVFELLKDQKTLKNSQEEFTDSQSDSKEQFDTGYLGQVITFANDFGEGFLTRPEETDFKFGSMSISVKSFGGEQRDIYNHNEKLLEMAKTGSYQLILTEDFKNDQEKTQQFLNAFKKVGQANYVDGLIAKPGYKLDTIDGQEHVLTSFQDIDRWVYRDYTLTQEDFTRRADVQAILQDPNSTLLPLGVNPSDNSLVTYDMAQGPLYQILSSLSSYKLERSLRVSQSGRTGFVSQDTVKSFDYGEYKSSLDPYIERINNGNVNQVPKQLLFLGLDYDELNSSSNDNAYYFGDEEKDKLKRILAEGTPVGLYSVLDVPYDAVNQGRFTITPDINARGYLIDGSVKDIDEDKSQITSVEGIKPDAVSNSMIFVQNGKAVTIKLPGREEK